MGSFTSSSKELPDQPVPTVDPEVERLAHVVVDGLIARLALEPAVPASSLLDNLAGSARAGRGPAPARPRAALAQLLTPVRAPNANAHAERWIRTVRAECLDWLLILGRGHLEHVLRVYVQHYNAHRPHRALCLEPPNPAARPTLICNDQPAQVRRRDLLGGLLHEYRRAA